ncbi:MAG: DUF819 family protein [Kistimonas sp.]|nr:DUF819 family protein [Kistimonas sp.]
MVTSEYSFLSTILLFTTAVLFCEKTLRWGIFRFIPGFLFIFLGCMAGASLQVWELTPTLRNFISELRYYLLPMMLFLLLLKHDARNLIKLGPRLLGTFALVSCSILTGFILVYILYKNQLESSAWETFSILSSSWIGGSTNMPAVQQGLNVGDNDPALLYAFLMDGVCASFWLLMMISLAPHRGLFNRFSGADSRKIDAMIESINLKNLEEENPREPQFMDLMAIIGLGLGVSGIMIALGTQVVNPGNLTEDDFLSGVRVFFSGNSWVVILATVAGILGSMTPLRRIKGSDHMGGVLLYVIVGLIASVSDFSSIDLGEASAYICAGFLILLFHLLVLLLAARIFKLDLYICGIASQANIGGSVSAPILAGIYNSALIPSGLLMGILGSALGTVTALMLGKILLAL